jgi:hypothetical protein
MFSLFKKQKITKQDLTNQLTECIGRVHEYVYDTFSKTINEFDKDKVHTECFYYSMHLFRSNFPPNEIIRGAIGQAIKKEFGSKISESDFHLIAQKIESRDKIYWEIYDNFFNHGKKMAIQSDFGFLFLGNSEFEGDELDDMPFNLGMGAHTGYLISILFTAYLKDVKSILDTEKKRLFRKFEIPNGVLNF